MADRRERGYGVCSQHTTVLERTEGELEYTRRAQREALQSARLAGVTLREIAEAIGVTRQRISHPWDNTCSHVAAARR